MIAVEVLKAAGLSDAEIIRVVEADQAAQREKDAAKREKNRIRQQKHRARNASHSDTCDARDTGTLSSLLPLDALTDSQESKKVVVEGRQASDWPSNYRELFWQKYPNKVGRPKALAKLDRVRQRGIPWGEIWEGLERYVVKNDDRAWCNPETWINQERWTDQPAKANGAGNGQQSRNSRAADESAVLAGFSRAFGGGDGELAGAADPEIPRGRHELDLEPTRRS